LTSLLSIPKKKIIYNNSGNNSPRCNSKAFIFDVNGFEKYRDAWRRDRSKKDCWTPSLYDKKGSGVYVSIDRYEPKSYPTYTSLEDIYAMINALTHMGHNVTVYGFKNSVNNAGKGWRKLDEFFNEKVQEYIKNNNLAEVAVLAKELNSHDFGFKNIKSCELSDGIFKEYVELGQKAIKAQEQVKGLPEKVINNISSATKNSLDEAWNKVRKQYPLLEHINSYSFKNIGKQVIEYVNAIELTKANN
jgi:hypothetical protein